MELRDGYTQTELGVIPQNWTVASLGSLAELTSSKRIFESDYVPFGIPFFRGKEISQLIDGEKINEPHFISESRFNEIKSQFGAPEFGDILITAVGTIANVFVVTNEAPFYFKDGNLIWLRNLNEVDSSYLCAQLRARRKEIINGAIGSSQKALTIVVLRDFSIPLPPILEQRAIAIALSDVDALIAGLEKLIAKKRDLKQAAMQQLLTGQTRLPGFSGDWVRNDLKNLVSTPITDGPHLTPTFYETGVPFLSVNNLANNRIDWSDLRFISKADDEIFSRKCKPLKGDVLLGKAASVGKVAIVEDDFDFNIWSPIALIRAGEKVNGKFLYYQLLSADCITQVLLLTNSSSQGNIGMGDIEKLQILYPCYEEQMAIAKVLADMDAELGSLETRLVKTRELKQGMMQELLTGRTRLL
jgi:type I restriction enzyme S subunit